MSIAKFFAVAIIVTGSLFTSSSLAASADPVYNCPPSAPAGAPECRGSTEPPPDAAVAPAKDAPPPHSAMTPRWGRELPQPVATPQRGHDVVWPTILPGPGDRKGQ